MILNVISLSRYEHVGMLRENAEKRKEKKIYMRVTIVLVISFENKYYSVLDKFFIQYAEGL